MGVRIEVVPFIVFSLLLGSVVWFVCRWVGVKDRGAVMAGVLVGLAMASYMLYFFRDPPRTPPASAGVIVAGADGRVAGIKVLSSNDFQNVMSFCGLTPENMGRFANAEVIRYSIFLSLFDVHVNRAPMAGQSSFLGYFPGKHIFTFKEKSSDYNQHNSILIRNEHTVCLYNQIVGPVARRVVYWLDHESPVQVKMGEPLGMMKFGSRLDLYFPKNDVEILSKVGDKVVAGETVIARLTREGAK